MKLLFIYVNTFLILFNFPVPLFYNSAILGVFLSIPFYLKNKLNNDNSILLVNIFKSSQFKLILYMFSTIIIYATMWSYFSGRGDYSILKGYLLVFFLMCCSIFVFPIIVNYLFKKELDTLNIIIKTIIIIFIIQSIIQLIAFLFPSIAEIVRSFHKIEFISDDENKFFKLRGLALTGNPFFSLASGYSLVFVFFFHLLNLKKIKYPIIIFCFLFLGSMFTGRTAFLGIFIGVGYYLINSKKGIFFFSKFFKIIMFIVLILFFTLSIYMILPVSIKGIVDDILLPWVFEFYYNYESTGSFSTTSSDILLDKMYYMIPLETFLLGDGQYSNLDGTYYGYTDAGYMRNILFYGLPGLILLIFMQSNIFKKIYNIKNEYKLFVTTLFFMLLVLHFKGDVLFHSPLINVLCMMLTFSIVPEQKQLKKYA